MEKEKRLREEKERVLREEEERLAKERRLKKKEEKKRLEVESREALRKDLRMEIRKHMRSVCEELHQQLVTTQTTKSKGKGKVPVNASSEDESCDSESSEIEALSEQAERLIISEKRKRSAERTTGDSPPMETPAKRTATRSVLDPKRLMLSVKRQPMKLSPAKKTPRSLRGVQKAKKVPASPDTMGRLLFVTDNIRDLGDRNIEELKQICRVENVPFEGLKKMDMILAITEKRSKVAYDTEAGADEVGRVDFYKLLSAQEEKAAVHFSFFIDSGNAWCGGWKSVARAFSNSIVCCGRQRKLLRMCKVDFEKGGTFDMVRLVRWLPKAGFDKRFLRSLFRNPRRLEVMKTCSLEALLRLNKAAGDFQKASSAAYLRRFIVRAIKLSYRWKLNAKLIIRLKFDYRIRLVEVRKLVNDKIEAVPVPPCLRDAARSMIRIVWVKNPSVAELIHNQRRFAKAEVSTCVCAGLPYPRVGVHVQFRQQELEGINPIICHATNVPKLGIPGRVKQLGREIAAGFAEWSNWTGPEICCQHSETKCMSGSSGKGEKFLDPSEVEGVKMALDGLVPTSVDRNAGETLVMCPASYYEGMMMMFVTSAGYNIVEESEAEVHRRMRAQAKDMNLQKFVRWDVKGKVGKAYIMPKHKDLTRYRPICPTFSEPTVRTCRAVAKGLNHLLRTMPTGSNFNLKSVGDLVPRLEKCNRRIAKSACGDFDLVSMSHDIKDMFTKLPHNDIVDAVDWVIDHHERKGRNSVRVNTKGKGCSFGSTVGDEAWRKLAFVDIQKFVRWELEHTFTRATGVLLRQVVGIPMGKSTSPPLACILCTFAEFKFLNSLGHWRLSVLGFRLMDDVSLVIINGRKKQTPVDLIRSRFEVCYPNGLTLKRTDQEQGSWDFLGTKMTVDVLHPYLRCVQSAKNEVSMWEDEKLEFKNGQTYYSWGCKMQKSAAIDSCLHRIMRNTNVRSAIPLRVLSLQRELMLKDFPSTSLQRVLKRFAVGRDSIWGWTYEWLYG
ncbi:hypothetical protein CBR_g52446 [Chara braunii]|uniref:Reverse transcriptase domain-containing protein n=1 Tax=Chara braunii TaxID=69332 RepID=A0A388MA89_CHABU|nr:hypothetical protein CBR_g52446 [Chara braunii]|eukprot:GBG91491.1 hypothetical protein CBR_g52446 [Chara braunii]